MLTLAEMSMASSDALGIDVDISSIGGPLRCDKKLFSESTGFVVEVLRSEQDAFLALAKDCNIGPMQLGTVAEESILRAYEGKNCLVELPVVDMKARWKEGLEHSLA